MARRLARLVELARRAHVPVLSANDNSGRWRSDFRSLLQGCARPGVRGRPIVELLAPPHDRDYFVVKPKHSGFYNTSLELQAGATKVGCTSSAGAATSPS